MKHLFLAFLFGVTTLSLRAQSSVSFNIGPTDFELSGKPFVIRCGEMHYARIPKKEWRARLKMAKAMGLNTVCAYLFWNTIEKQPGEFTWADQSDAAEFCRIAQQEGLYVILRPGPYSCAEWDFGGFPWWLLKDKSMQLRTQYPYYLQCSKRYLQEVGKELAPLQVTHGGNIIMVQVENEYGSYGNDTTYMNLIKSYLLAAGFNVPMFHCDGPSQLPADHPANLFAAVNFGSDPEENFKALREIQPTGPLMCSEYYPGWFDSWGRPHHSGDTRRIVAELKYMLDHHASFSIYMVHGGTSFGTYSGANAPPYLPQTTSYDYDAPIDETGNPTEKFYALRELFSKYLQPGETLPEVPARTHAQQPRPVQFTAVAPLMANLPAQQKTENPVNMEALNQDFGSVLYTITLVKGAKAVLQLETMHDYALVYLGGKYLGSLDRRKNALSIPIPARSKPAELRILVEATGRVNYGGAMLDNKGITGKVKLIQGDSSIVIKQWNNYPLRMGEHTIPVKYQPYQKQPAAAGFYKGKFTTADTAFTYLDLSKWNKGLVWINGQCLGRYWNIGPTQTMLVPGTWLKQGENEVVVFDLYGVNDPQLTFRAHPVLDSMNEKQPQLHKKEGQQWSNKQPSYFDGEFENNTKWQQASFKPVKARYFCFEALSSFNERPFTTVAEIVLIDKTGKEIPREHWKIAYADSEELEGDDGNAANVFDQQFTSIWHTQWQDKSPGHPHQVVIDLDNVYEVAGLKLLPRQDGENGRVKAYKLYFSTTRFPGI